MKKTASWPRFLAIRLLTFAEIGALHEKTESWARVTYYRAKTMLAQRLEE